MAAGPALPAPAPAPVLAPGPAPGSSHGSRPRPHQTAAEAAHLADQLRALTDAGNNGWVHNGAWAAANNRLLLALHTSAGRSMFTCAPDAMQYILHDACKSQVSSRQLAAVQRTMHHARNSHGTFTMKGRQRLTHREHSQPQLRTRRCSMSHTMPAPPAAPPLLLPPCPYVFQMQWPVALWPRARAAPAPAVATAPPGRGSAAPAGSCSVTRAGAGQPHPSTSGTHNLC